MAVARTQTLVQLSEELLAVLDARAARERRSRSELIREALDAYLEADREAAISAAIVEGYTRIPQDEHDDLEGWARRGARDMLREESW